MTSPILQHPDSERHFYIHCDASDIGIGVVLFQKDDDVGEHPIAYSSPKLTPTQKNYSVTERECIAVVLAIGIFRSYVELLPITIITDHSSPKWLMATRNFSGRLAKWSLHLQAYDFQIEHRAGTQNVVPDTLSLYDTEEVGIPLSGVIDMNAPAFSSDEYRDLVKVIASNNDQLPGLQKSPALHSRTGM